MRIAADAKLAACTQKHTTVKRLHNKIVVATSPKAYSKKGSTEEGPARIDYRER